MKKFEFYEHVMVATTKEVSKDIRGEEGVVMGVSENDGKTCYALSIESISDELRMVDEEYLTTLNKFSRRDDFYDGESIRVSPDGEPL